MMLDEDLVVGPDPLNTHDRRFVAAAVLEKADKVEKLGKAASDQGYEKEAGVLKGDAVYAREQLVSRFRDEQIEAIGALVGLRVVVEE